MTGRVLGADTWSGESLEVSAVGLGCHSFGRQGSGTRDHDGADAVLGACLDHGVMLLDTAALYGGDESLSEAYIGRSLAHGALKGRRDELVIATKAGHSAEPMAQVADAPPRGSRAYLRKAVEGSLRRLRTDWIDLYQLHEPDPLTPVADTLQALTELVQEGKVRFIGCSNVTATQLVEADGVATHQHLAGFISVQNEYSLLHREPEAEVLPAAIERGIGLLSYSPLASGLLTGKYHRDEPAPAGSRLVTAPRRFDAVTDLQWEWIETFRSLCRARDLTMTEASIAWLLSRPGVGSAIAGATTPHQVAANAAAATIEVDADALAEIDDLFS